MQKRRGCFSCDALASSTASAAHPGKGALHSSRDTWHVPYPEEMDKKNLQPRLWTSSNITHYQV